jgi:predicted RNA-binding Zn ribbon-like protein
MAASVEPLFVADHPALDLLNTVLLVDGQLTDVLQSDDDVLRWLVTGGLVDPRASVPVRRGRSLLSAARALRELVRELVRQKQAGERLDVAAFNAFLAQGKQDHVLVQERAGRVRLEQRFASDTPEQLLMPLALAAADLLAHGDFDLVRTCESEDCVLQFYDRTKSHRRRWCSMATCGNRHKVQMFRERKRAGQ